MPTMNPPQIRVMAIGEDPNANEPVEDFTLPMPKFQPEGSRKVPLEDALAEETLNFKKVKDVSGAKFQYKLSFDLVPSAQYDSLVARLIMTAVPYDVYFKFERWGETSAWRKVLVEISEEVIYAGVPDSAKNYLVDVSLTITEVDSRI